MFNVKKTCSRHIILLNTSVLFWLY